MNIPIPQHGSVTEQLEAIGLSNHEAALYVEILRNGEASVGMLLENVKLHREQAYRALKRLEDAGLVRQYEKRKRAYFAVTDTDLLVKEVEEKVHIAKSLQPLLKGMHIRQPHVVQVREGAASFSSLFEDILESVKKDGEYLILGGQGDGFEQLKEVWPIYEKGVKVFAKNNIRLRMIAFEGQDFADQFIAQPLLEIRELPGAYIGPVATVIFGNKVALEVMDPENTSIVTIENKQIAESYRQQFEALWKLAKPVERPKSLADYYTEVDRTVDGLGMGIDEGIKELVVSLWALGIQTTGSCEGHKERGCPYPWLDIETPDPDQWQGNKDIQALWREANLKNRAPLERFLLEFYGANLPKIALFDRGIFGAARLKTVDTSEDNKLLVAHQREMDAFARFLRAKVIIS